MDEEDKLTPKQEAFCIFYATDKEFFGNGVQAYIEVYNPNQSKPNWYKTACAASSRLLSNVKVCERINELLEESGFNDIAVDKQLAFLLTQFSDFKTKLGAIKEYNKLKQRITEKSEIDHKGITVVVEGAYDRKPNFRPTNSVSKTDDVATESS